MSVIRSFNSNSAVIQTIYLKFVLIRTLYLKFFVIRILCIRIYIVIHTHLYASLTSLTWNKINSIQYNAICYGLFYNLWHLWLKSSWKIIKRIYSIIRISCTDDAACSNVSSMSLTYPGSCKSCFSCKPVLAGKFL